MQSGLKILILALLFKVTVLLEHFTAEGYTEEHWFFFLLYYYVQFVQSHQFAASQSYNVMWSWQLGIEFIISLAPLQTAHFLANFLHHKSHFKNQLYAAESWAVTSFVLSNHPAYDDVKFP